MHAFCMTLFVHVPRCLCIGTKYLAMENFLYPDMLTITIRVSSSFGQIEMIQKHFNKSGNTVH